MANNSGFLPNLILYLIIKLNYRSETEGISAGYEDNENCCTKMKIKNGK